MLTPADICPGFAKARLGAALRDQSAGEAHIGLWQEEQADRLGIKLATFLDYYYGRSPADCDTLIRMVAHFGPAFLSAYMSPLRIVCAPEESPPVMAAMARELKDILARLKEIAARAERKPSQAAVMPMKHEGKVS